VIEVGVDPDFARFVGVDGGVVSVDLGELGHGLVPPRIVVFEEWFPAASNASTEIL
jgi:hypothetical protein